MPFRGPSGPSPGIASSQTCPLNYGATEQYYIIILYNIMIVLYYIKLYYIVVEPSNLVVEPSNLVVEPSNLVVEHAEWGSAPGQKLF